MQRECAGCGAVLTKKTQKEYCSLACAGRAGGAARAVRYKEAASTHICQQCGKEYRPKAKDRTTFCSRECAFAFKKAHRKPEKPKGIKTPRYCEICGAPLTALQQKYCGRECQAKAQSRRSGQIISAICRGCGETFEYVRYNLEREYCSRKCSKTATQERNPVAYKRMRRVARQKRRARKYGNGPVDAIDPMVVYERDGWRCGICGKKVSRHSSCPYPLSPSLDHIVPLAAGGTHTWGNVQCAHFMCNSRKGATEGTVGANQLLLEM